LILFTDHPSIYGFPFRGTCTDRDSGEERK